MKTGQRFLDYCLRVRKRFLKFGLVGASGTIVDLGIVVGLNSLFAGRETDWLVMNIIQFSGYECSVFSNYLLSFFWVWKDRQGHFWFNFIKYNLSTAIAFACRLVLFNLGMVIAGSLGRNKLVYYLIYFFSIGGAMVINFLVINHKVFSGKEIDETKDKHYSTNIQ